jgi:hypothetical protein
MIIYITDIFNEYSSVNKFMYFKSIFIIYNILFKNHEK